MLNKAAIIWSNTEKNSNIMELFLRIVFNFNIF